MNLATTVVLLFGLAAGVALLARSLRVPYTVALVVAGLILGPTHMLGAVHLTKELLYAVFLPGLLFEAAFHLDARQFWLDKGPIVALALPGVLLAIVVTAPALVWASRAALVPVFGWPAALVFAALITATDPIAVVALFKTLGAPSRLGVIIEGESLVNDGTSVVLYTLAVGLATGADTGAWNAVADFLRVVGLGVGVGAAMGLVFSEVIARIDDPLIEITLTTITAYASFIVAEQFHVSGVLATVAAGMVSGSYGAPGAMSASTRVAVESFWQYVAFALNSIVFLLIGFQVSLGRLLQSWQPIAAAYIVVMAARAGVVFLVLAIFRRSSKRIPWRWGAVLTWGGLRGALSMVLALALADDFPERSRVVTVTFGVVILSILVNGLTVGPILRWLGLAKPLRQ
jgi:CPA1 family monovalent cation:H+ antiporter